MSVPAGRGGRLAGPARSEGWPRKEDHPTQKPVVLSEIPIRNHLRPGEAVFEPWSGNEQRGTECAARGVAASGL